ncbi:MAG: hypothetical protein LBQ20_09970, partial [Rhodanobacter sp.]|nr:hypothetical protein [Rhodanobacter sp.]
RLTSALEFHAKYLLAYNQDNGYKIPEYICNGVVDFSSLKPTYEIGYNHYHNRLDISLPFTNQYLTSVIRQKISTEYHIMVYETLTHSGDDVFGQR